MLRDEVYGPILVLLERIPSLEDWSLHASLYILLVKVLSRR